MNNSNPDRLLISEMNCAIDLFRGCRLGAAAFLIYLCALGFYCYMRTRFTLDLGPYIVYGIVIFAIEMMGATATILYGMNLVLRPVYEEIRNEDGKVLCQYPYHVRVLVPCYQEPLSLVKRTIEAALDAELPKGVHRTIYLLDDGKDPKKRRWCSSMGSEGAALQHIPTPRHVCALTGLGFAMGIIPLSYLCLV